MPELLEMNVPEEKIRYLDIRDKKYSIAEDFYIDIPIGIEKPIEEEHVALYPYYNMPGWSRLLIKKGFLSDGPSGPTLDTEDSMLGAFVHDALYYLMRKGHLLEFRKKIDRIFHTILVGRGMDKERARRWYRFVRWFGKKSAEERWIKVYEA